MGHLGLDSQRERVEYERAYQHTRRNLRTRRERIAFFQLPLDARILDYGCGDGLDLHCFRSLGYQNVIGIDYSANLLRDLAADSVVQGNCEQTPFPTETFDAIFVNSVLHHLDFDRAVVESHRILKPGGYLCIVEQRRGLPRQILDFITFSPLGLIVPSEIIRNRRIALRLERREYTTWLRRERRLVADLQREGFEIVGKRDTLLSVLVAGRRM